MSSSTEASLFYLPGTSDYLALLAGDWLQFVKLRLPQLETAFIPLLALLFALIVLKRNLSIEAVGLANRETRYRSPRLKAVKVADYFLGDNVQDFRKQEDLSKAMIREGKSAQRSRKLVVPVQGCIVLKHKVYIFDTFFKGVVCAQTIPLFGFFPVSLKGR